MDLINTNYAIAKRPSFGAGLSIQSENKNLTAGQIELLKQFAARIGNDNDTIDIKVGESYAGTKGDWEDAVDYVSCGMSAKATFAGQTTEKSLEDGHEGRSVISPYSTLKSYLVELQKKFSPVPLEKIPNKIESLKKELGSAKKDIENLEAQVQGAKKAYEEAVAAKNAADAKKQVIGDEIARLEERQRGYQDLMNG